MKLLKRGRVFLATILLLTPVISSGRNFDTEQSLFPVPISACNSGTDNSHRTDVVRPTWIDLTSSQVGLLQTPKFPQPFALPLECLWIFNLTEIPTNSRRNYLHFYFTQFYLEDNILKVTALNTSWPLKNRDVLNWSDVDSLHGGDPASLEGWTPMRHFGDPIHGQMQSAKGETYILLRMRANSTSYDRLHKRVLEVDDVYGFNITYELMPNEIGRTDACTLGLCNFNGECFLNVNSTTNSVGDFFLPMCLTEVCSIAK